MASALVEPWVAVDAGGIECCLDEAAVDDVGDCDLSEVLELRVGVDAVDRLAEFRGVEAAVDAPAAGDGLDGALLKEPDEARELAMEMEQPGVARAASMDKARLAGLLDSGGKTRRAVANVSIALAPRIWLSDSCRLSANTRGRRLP